MHTRPVCALLLLVSAAPVVAGAECDWSQQCVEGTSKNRIHERQAAGTLSQASAQPLLPVAQTGATIVTSAQTTTAAASPAAPIAAATAGATTAAATGDTSNPNAFNPSVSVILSGGYAHLSQDPASYRLSGYALGGDAGPGSRGFSLSESELSLAANVDPYLAGALTVSMAPDDTLSVEEAFFQTTALSDGLRLKGGRHFSGVGYLNEQHAHVWDFIDSPLAYRAFLGGQFGDDGVQLRWLAPIDTYLDLGVEVGRGRGFPGSDSDRNGAGASAFYAHTGGDVGVGGSWRAGLSYLSASPRARESVGMSAGPEASRDLFTGASRLWIADFVYKWSPNGNPTRQNLKVQAEFFTRRETGTLVLDADGAAAVGPLAGDYRSQQRGGYAQAVYQFMPRWSTGFRYDRLARGQIDFAAADPDTFAPHFDPTRSSALLQYAPSEFSRFRIQIAADRSRPGVTDSQVLINYQMSLGAHGAHNF